MITYKKRIGSYVHNKQNVIWGLSTDTKPSVAKGYELSNTDIFYEFDTQKVYIYDAQNKKWIVQ